MKTEVGCRRAVVNLNLQEIQDLNSYRIAYGNRGFKFARSAMEKVIEAWKVAGKDSLAVGNAAAMREALDKAHRVLHCAIIAGILRGDDAYDAMNMSAAALAAPARNCDKYTSESDAKRAFLDYRNWLFGSDYDLGDLKHNVDGITAEYAEWLVAPEREEKGGDE